VWVEASYPFVPRAHAFDEFTKACHEGQQKAKGEDSYQEPGQHIRVRRRAGVDEVQRHFEDERHRGDETGDTGEAACQCLIH
jgi:hypothetical protein